MAAKILVVEDDFDARYVLSLVLREEGHEVITAADGQCALSITIEQMPDLIITDISMPRLNGIELIRRLRLEPVTASIPIIAITAYGPATVKHALAAGASKCAMKPILFDDFLVTVKELLP